MDFNKFDDEAALSGKGIAVLFLSLIGMCAFIEGLLIFFIDWNFWALLAAALSALLLWGCFAFACTPAAYKKVGREEP